MNRTRKTAIAIPNDDFKQIELCCRQTGKSRSRLLVEAFRVWRNLQQKNSRDWLYERAYKKNPEQIGEIQAGMKAGMAVWNKESW